MPCQPGSVKDLPERADLRTREISARTERAPNVPRLNTTPKNSHLLVSGDRGPGLGAPDCELRDVALGRDHGLPAVHSVRDEGRLGLAVARRCLLYETGVRVPLVDDEQLRRRFRCLGPLRAHAAVEPEIDRC
jgi:hypothetical protein